MTRDSYEAPKPPPIVVPTTFRTEITLPPGGTEEQTISLDVDTVIDGIEIQAEGPAIVRVRFGASAQPQSPRPANSQSFGDYLEQELPRHLARLVGEDLEEWDSRNRTLHQAAVGGDDDALFELLARDPRQFRSELVLGRILTWRTWIDEYNRFFRLKLNRLFAEQEHVTAARQRVEQAQQNLARLGQSQLRLYDQRGKRPMPPTAYVRGIYYALLCLLQALRRLYREQASVGARPAQIATTIAKFVRELTSVRPTTSPFLPWVQKAVHLLSDAEVVAGAGFNSASVSDLVGPKDAMPSDTARALTAAAFEVSTDTVERLAAKPVAIPIGSTQEEELLLAGPLTYDLLEFPEVKPLVDRLTR